MTIVLALGELLRNTGEFMNSRFKEVCDTILRYRDHKEKIIKRTVIILLPRLASFAPEEVCTRPETTHSFPSPKPQKVLC
jgi:hypothetical protein